MEVLDSGGKHLGYIETKSGGAKYDALPRQKDDWLRSRGFTIDVVYGR